MRLKRIRRQWECLIGIKGPETGRNGGVVHRKRRSTSDCSFRGVGGRGGEGEQEADGDNDDHDLDLCALQTTAEHPSSL
jgi:hypothetical protein